LGVVPLLHSASDMTKTGIQQAMKISQEKVKTVQKCNNRQGNLRERDHWGDPDVDGRIILRRIFRKMEGVVGTGWSWLRTGTGGGHL